MAGDGSIIIDTQLNTEGLEKGLENLKQLLENGLGGAKVSFSRAFEEMGSSIDKDTFSDGIGRLFSSVAEAIQGKAAELCSAVGSAAGDAAAEVTAAEGEFRSGGAGLAAAAAEGFSAGGEAMGGAAEEAARDAADRMRIDGEFEAVGRNLMNALRIGISSAASGLYAKAVEIASGIVSTVKGAFKIHSPSAVFRDEIGKMLMLGLRDGILNNSEAVLAATEALAEDILESERRYLAEKERLDREHDEADEARRVAEYEKKLALAKSLEEKQQLIETERLRLRKRADSQYLEQLKEAAENEKDIVDGLKKDITASYKEMARYIEDSLSPIEESRQKLEDKLKSYAEDNNSGTVKIRLIDKDGSEMGRLYSLADQRETIETLTRYAEAVRETVSRIETEFDPQVARDFMRSLAGMDVEEGALFAETLISAPMEDFRKYIEDWELKNSLAEEISRQLYGEEFTEAVYDAAEYMKNELERLGLEVPEGFFASGSLSAKEFGRGFSEGLDQVLEDARALVESFGSFSGEVIGGSVKSVVNNNNYYSTYSVNGTRSTAAESIFAIEAAAAMNKYRGLD